MREILFRAQRVVDKEWVEGFLLQGINKDVMLIQYWSNERGYCMEDIIPETVGQFTGKHDTSGKMIFEKDKIKWAGEDTIYAVEFEGGSFICVSVDTSFNLSDYADCEYELI